MRSGVLAAAMSSLAVVSAFYRIPRACYMLSMKVAPQAGRAGGYNSGMLSRGRQGGAIRRFASVGSGQGFRTNDARTLNWDKKGGDNDVFISSLSSNGHVNVKVISAKNLVQGIIDRQGMSDVSTEVLGRVMLATVLAAHGIKDEETLQLKFAGDGLSKGVMAISDGACNVRGWIGNTELGDELKSDMAGRPNMKAAVGAGTLQVVKAHPMWPLPYNGIVEIVSGEVATDVAWYLASSEQRNTAIGVGVIVEAKNVLSAGGFYVEMMPGAEEESIAQVEQNLMALREKYGSLDPGRLFWGEKKMSPYKLVDALLEGLGVGMAEETQPAYKCGCSKEKVVRAIGLLQKEEIADILEKQEEVGAKCEFCGEYYTLTREEVMELASA